MSTWSKQLKYLFWIGVSVLGIALVFIICKIFSSSGDKIHADALVQTVQKKLETKVNQAQEDALVARVKATVEAQEADKRLDEITQIQDGVERRKRLAELLNK